MPGGGGLMQRPSRSLLRVQVEKASGSLLKYHCRHEATQARDQLRLLTNYIAQSRSFALENLAHGFRNQFWARSLLFVFTNGVERALPPGVILTHPLRR